VGWLVPRFKACQAETNLKPRHYSGRVAMTSCPLIQVFNDGSYHADCGIALLTISRSKSLEELAGYRLPGRSFFTGVIAGGFTGSPGIRRRSPCCRFGRLDP